MAGETILVIDGGKDIDEGMTTALEAESYLVYPVSSQEVNAELAELLKPSLIYIKPLELSPTGLKSCKAIHEIPLLKKVPVVILTSLKRELAPDYFRDYGIVDFLEPTFGPEDLIEKTRTILDKPLPSGSRKEREQVASPKAARNNRKSRFALPRPAILRPAIGIVIFLVIVGVAFLIYQQFMPIRKVSPPPKIASPLKVPSKTSEAGSKAQLPPGIVVETPAPASPVTTQPPGSEPKSQLPPGKTVTEAPAPASPATAAAPGAGSKSQLPPGKTPAETPVPASPVTTVASGAGSKSQLPPGKKVAETPKPATSLPPTPPGKPTSISSKSASQPPGKSFCSVQLGAFKNEETAQALTKKFKDKGYDAFTHRGVTKDGSPIYRVLVGKYEERKAARKAGREIQSREEIATTVYSD
jgi:CheY-like chemotaxis protein